MVSSVGRVLLRRYFFTEIGTSLEEQQQEDGSGERPIEPATRGRHTEQVERQPAALFGGVIRVANLSPQASGAEALLLLLRQRFVGCFPAVFFRLKMVLLLVSDGLDDYEHKEQKSRQPVQPVQRLVFSLPGHHGRQREQQDETLLVKRDKKKN